MSDTRRLAATIYREQRGYVTREIDHWEGLG